MAQQWQPPIITLVGTPCVAFPEQSFDQQETCEKLGIENPVAKRFFASNHIESRRLQALQQQPAEHDSEDEISSSESSGAPLKAKAGFNACERQAIFQSGIQGFGKRAVEDLLDSKNTDASSIDILVCVTSTGLPMPGLSAIIMKEIPGFRPDVQRMDIVGMGCNGGLSGLRTLSMALQSQAMIRSKKALGLLLCFEVNSAFVRLKDTIGDGIVNALFGDGAVATLVAAEPQPANDHHPFLLMPHQPPNSILPGRPSGPEPQIRLLDFESYTMTDYSDDMAYQVDPETQLQHFVLSKRIPFAIGESVQFPVNTLLRRHGQQVDGIDHYVVHGGGRKVAERIAKSLDLEVEQDLRHTLSVLREYGNVSSASFLISLWKLCQEHRATGCLAAGQKILFVAMGPGATIEVALGEVVKIYEPPLGHMGNMVKRDQQQAPSHTPISTGVAHGRQVCGDVGSVLQVRT